jgi:hypothetical protein
LLNASLFNMCCLKVFDDLCVNNRIGTVHHAELSQKLVLHFTLGFAVIVNWIHQFQALPAESCLE